MSQAKISKKISEKVFEKAKHMAETEEINLRAHHMLCMQLFRGEGYSDGFSVGMTNVIQTIRNSPSLKIKLLREPDAICENCPNLKPDFQCSLSNLDVVQKDEGVLSVLGQQAGEYYSYDQLLKALKENMKEDSFAEICGSCRWHKAGLCSYELLQESFQKENQD